MAYANGFYYGDRPAVGSKCVFVKAADLWRGSDSLESDYSCYLFPPFWLGTLLEIAPSEYQDRNPSWFEFKVQWETGEHRGQVETEQSQSYVILKNEADLQSFLRETQEEVLVKLEQELCKRRLDYLGFEKKLKELASLNRTPDKQGREQSLADLYLPKFHELLGVYWNIAYGEGLRQATTDDEKHSAQKALAALLEYFKGILRELERTSRWLKEADTEWSLKLEAADGEVIQLRRELAAAELESGKHARRSAQLEDRIRQALAVLNPDEAEEARILLKAVL
jgi:hypothetical protein